MQWLDKIVWMEFRGAALNLAPCYIHARLFEARFSFKIDLPPTSELHGASAWVARSGTIVSMGPLMLVIPLPLALLHTLLHGHHVVR